MLIALATKWLKRPSGGILWPHTFLAPPSPDGDPAHWIAVITVAHAGELIDIARYHANEKNYPNAHEPAYAKRYVDVDIIMSQQPTRHGAYFQDCA